MLGPPTNRSEFLATPRHPAYADVSDEAWSDWRWQLRHRVTTADELAGLIALTPEEREGIARRASVFPFAVTPYYLSLFEGPDCPVRRQAIPHVNETTTTSWDREDPLGEDEHASGILTHRYPDRALLYVTHTCPVYCRHCTRQRKVGDEASAPTRSEFEAAYAYLRKTPAVRDVLVSGGDPLSLSDDRLVEIVSRLREIESVEIIRLCTRNPVTLPQRVTEALVERLAAYHPVYVNTHFNHPRECTPEAALALRRFADRGFVVGNQMVLLRGVNDDAEVVETLNRWLLRQRCRPYYIFQCDPVGGTAHLRTEIEDGLAILDALRGRVSGLAIPSFAVDLPGGGGKVTLDPRRLVRRHRETWTFRNAEGDLYTYGPDDAGCSSAGAVDSGSGDLLQEGGAPET